MRVTLDNLPEPLKSEMEAKYLQIRTDEAAKRERTDEPGMPQLPAFGHKPADYLTDNERQTLRDTLKDLAD
jgi:hypothetical protein